MSKPWGGVGAWAADAERAEAEEQEAAAAAAKLPPQSFPSLKEAAVAKPKKTKKMTLSEFTTGNYVGPGAVQRRELSSFDSKGLTPDEMLRLPKGPKERSNEEMEQSRGFRSYGGGGRSGPSRMRDDNDGGGGGGGRRYGGFDDEMRTPRAEFDQPSRADGVDNWAAEKKPLPVGRSDRYNSLGGGSRADDVDNWAMGKKPPPARTTGFGSGFRDPGPREPDRWGRGGTGGGMGGMHEISGPDGDRERPKLVLDRPSGDGGSLNEVGKTTRPSPFGAARPREEILAEKGLDWRKLEADIETKKSTSRPTSSHSSRPSSAHSSRPVTPGQQVLEAAVTAKPKVNPFGDAKPREVLLQEKGKDWRKIDFELEHRGVDRPESKEEQELKEEIEHLKKELEKEATIKTNGETVQGPGGNEISLHEVILHKEKDLELLICELDDKVRFGPKFSDRPSSGAGRFGGFSDRPPSSHSGISEEFRNTEFMDRPRSRGTGDVWTQPGDDRRAFHSGGTGEFMDRPHSRGTREFMDRPRSRGTGEFMERPQSRGTGEFMDRPRSRGTGEFMDRPRSRGTGDIWSGDDRRAFQGGGAVEFMDRPRSRGTGDAWSKPGDDRRAFQGSGSGNPWSRPGDDQRSFQGGSEKGFIGNRDMDRTSSRNRW